MPDAAKLSRSKARSWAWAQPVEPRLKLVLLAIARTGTVELTDEVARLCGVPRQSLEPTFDTLTVLGLLAGIDEVLQLGRAADVFSYRMEESR